MSPSPETTLWFSCSCTHLRQNSSSIHSRKRLVKKEHGWGQLAEGYEAKTVSGTKYARMNKCKLTKLECLKAHLMPR